MRHHRSSKLKRHRTFEEFVVVDMAGNTIAHFETEELAKRFVETEAHGRRIVRMNMNGMTTIINNEAYNPIADRPNGVPWD